MYPGRPGIKIKNKIINLQSMFLSSASENKVFLAQKHKN